MRGNKACATRAQTVGPFLCISAQRCPPLATASSPVHSLRALCSAPGAVSVTMLEVGLGGVFPWPSRYRIANLLATDRSSLSSMPSSKKAGVSGLVFLTFILDVDVGVAGSEVFERRASRLSHHVARQVGRTSGRPLRTPLWCPKSHVQANCNTAGVTAGTGCPFMPRTGDLSLSVDS